MQGELKTLKQYCKEAKKRLKSGFWQEYEKDLNSEIEKARKNGVPESKVKRFFTNRVENDIKNVKDKNESFYQQVKLLLDTEGEVSDAIGRLTDQTEFSKLSYEEKQRYTLDVSERYLKALERYKMEKMLEYEN